MSLPHVLASLPQCGLFLLIRGVHQKLKIRLEIGEVAGNAAKYVDPFDIDDISNGIEEIFSNKKLHRKLSKDGLQQAKKFSWKKTAENTVAVYEKHLEK